MARMTLADTARRLKGTMLQGDPSTVFETFNFDSRRSSQGELFFALEAERNGHEFILHSRKMGASGAVVSEPVTVPDVSFALIRVKDTLQALQDLGHSVLQNYDVKVIGITGSVGKTSTRAFTASLLGSHLKVLESEKNFNNHIGVPITLLRLTENFDTAVLEMGTNSPGEILRLTEIAPPDCAVITNIQPVHLEFFNSIDDIALAKKEILDGMPPGGTAVLNGDDPRVRKIAADFKGEILYFGDSSDCRIRLIDIKQKGLDGQDIQLDYGGQPCSLRLPFFYQSHVRNFMAAAGVGLVFGLTPGDIINIGEILPSLPMRGSLHRLSGNRVLIDDSYNSNPAALTAALTSLAKIPSTRHVAVLGDMLELGPEEDRFHTEAGELAHKLGWNFLITIGPLGHRIAEGAINAGMERKKVLSYEDMDSLYREADRLFRPGDLILVKGSRAIQLEKMVLFLKKSL